MELVKINTSVPMRAKPRFLQVTMVVLGFLTVGVLFEIIDSNMKMQNLDESMIAQGYVPFDKKSLSGKNIYVNSETGDILAGSSESDLSTLSSMVAHNE